MMPTRNAASAPKIANRIPVICQIKRSLSVTANISLENLYRTVGQRLHECAAVGFGHNPIIQDDDDAAVGLGADQTTYPLSQS
jgi:hypothetical protein